MHILFALPGLHRVRRGAEVALESVAQEIAAGGKHEVTLIGSGRVLPGRAYNFKHAPALSRTWFENWPTVPFLRSEYMYEELTFAASAIFGRWSDLADITVTCGYPYTSWALRRFRVGRRRPPHVFVTQNGDWPATERRAEAAFFSCDGLICTNPVYFERNHEHWFSALIPNGIHPDQFLPGPSQRARLGLPDDRRIALIVSALEHDKRVLEAIRAMSIVKDVFLVIAGDGSLRAQVDALAAELMPGRYMRRTFPHEEMPALYRSADVFLHMALRESFGNVYIEALSSGTPIVANDDEVTRWILGDHALLVDARSEQAIVEAVTESLRGARGQTGQAVEWGHSRYSWSKVAGKYLEFFDNVRARQRRR